MSLARNAIATVGMTVMLATALPVAAADHDAGDQTDAIVVTGVPTDREALGHATTAFVAKVSTIAERPQLARRAKMFCPNVVGLDPQYVPIVMERLRDAAKAAGVVERPAGCTIDVAVVFVTDGDRLLTDLRKIKPQYFAELQPSKLRELFGSGRGIRWWYSTDAEYRAATHDAAGETKRYQASLINTQIKLSLGGTVVVVDVSRTEGYPLDAVASYAAMVSFAEISGRDAGMADTPSVLGMFVRGGARADAQRELSAWDKAYLHSLYAARPDRPSDKQRRELAGLMRDALLP